MMEISVVRYSWLLLIVAVALGADDFTVEHVPYLNAKAADWQSARDACNIVPSFVPSLSSCDLGTRPDQDMAAGLTAGSYYWVGARKKDVVQWTESAANGEALIKYVGCYDMGVTMKRSTRDSAYNSPARCLSKCTGNYAALKNTTCYCIEPEKLMSWTQSPREMCPINCKYESYQCGGYDNFVSVYKIPDDTLLQVAGRGKKYFWRRSNNNVKEFIIITNIPRSTQGKTCVSPTGQYTRTDKKSSCPAGTELLSFRTMNVTNFLATNYWQDMDRTDYQLPLGISKQMMWLDGRKVFKSVKGVKGACLAISLSSKDNGYYLTKRKCTEKLPSVCGCFSKALITTTTMATTTTTEPTTTTTEPTTTTTEPTTTTMTTMETSTTTEMITTLPTTPEPTSSSTTMTTTTTSMPSTTTTSAEPSSPTASEEPATTTQTTTSTWPSDFWTTSREKSSSAAIAPGLKDATTVMSGATSSTEGAQERAPMTNNSVLFPFHSSNRSDNVLEPAPVGPSQTRDEGNNDSASSAAMSLEMIVGVTIGVIVIAVLVIFVLVIVVKRRKTNSSTLLKKEQRSSKGNTNYPI